MNEQQKIIDLLQQSLDEKTKALEDERLDKKNLLITLKNILTHIQRDKTINAFTFLEIDGIIKIGISKLTTRWKEYSQHNDK